ncbi:hypothetical protein ACGF12_29110 [Kitasatospora sp. NPDC048296]|uniref:hypothetical protein n=1 Tax=Kitasatospora sp. NPDC048296 TaxID=3364048 RepID=UPI00371D6167
MPRRRSGGFAEVLAALPSREAHEPRSREHPVAAGGFLDADGCYWRLARGPLERRPAKRLAVGADEMTLGDWHEDFPDALVPVLLAPEERPAAWRKASAEDPRAYGFRAADGRTLLYLDVFC